MGGGAWGDTIPRTGNIHRDFGDLDKWHEYRRMRGRYMPTPPNPKPPSVIAFDLGPRQRSSISRSQTVPASGKGFRIRRLRTGSYEP